MIFNHVSLVEMLHFDNAKNKRKRNRFVELLIKQTMEVVDRLQSREVNNRNPVIGSPLTGHRRSLVRNIQVETENIRDEHSHKKLTCSSFFTSTLHCLGIIFGDM